MHNVTYTKIPPPDICAFALRAKTNYLASKRPEKEQIIKKSEYRNYITVCQCQFSSNEKMGGEYFSSVLHFFIPTFVIPFNSTPTCTEPRTE